MVGRGPANVVDDRLDDGVVVAAAPAAVPVDVAGDALGDEFAVGYIRQRTKMDVGEMGKPEHANLVGEAALSCQPAKA